MPSTGVRFIDRLRMRWQSLIHRGRLDQELSEELSFHLANLVESYRRQGFTQAEATRRARLEMGGPTQISEEARDQRGWQRLDQLRADTRLAFRTFRKYPGFTLTAVATIALGMGANTALFTVMHGLLLRPLPIADPGSMRNVYLEVDGSRSRSGYGSSAFVSFVEFQAIQAGAQSAEIAGIAPIDLSWRGTSNRAIRAQLVSANLLALIGARPVLGRFFAPEEVTTAGSAPVVVLSHGFWRRDLGSDPGIVGKSLTLNRTPFTVIGVADEATRGPLLQTAHLWIPLTMQRITRPGESLVDDPTAGWIQIFARPRPGTTDDAVLAEMRVLGPRAVATHDTAGRTVATVVPASFLNTPKLRREGTPVIALVWVAVSLILVVACANVANMLLARGLSRRREIAVRLAIGAGRGRVLAQLLTESAWLGVLGGALGLGLAAVLGRLVPAVLPGGADVQLALSPDRAVLAFTGIVSILSGLAFGLLPALQTVRPDLAASLKTEGLLAVGRPRLRLQEALVGLQVAGCVVLLVVAGLLVRSFGRALTMDLGKPLHHLVITGFDLRQQQYTAEQAEMFFRRLEERIAGSSSVVRSGTSILDPELSSANNIIRLGDSAAADGERVAVAFDEVGTGYFEAAGLPLLAGRTFTEQEVRAGFPVAVIDQRLADRHFGGRAVGQRLWLDDRQGKRLHEIVGVVGSTQPIGIGNRALPSYFVPITGLRYLEAKLWVRYRGEPGPTVAAIRRAAETLDREVQVRTRTIEENIQEALLPMKILSGSLAALGGLALALASIGLFGVIGFSVGRRSREIAIRMAVGATPREVITLVFRQGLPPVMGGLVAGVGMAAVGGQLIRAVLIGVSPFDPVAVGAVILLVGAAAVLAFVVPARRAAAVRPSQLLRVD
ncbi:MAG: ADOP family duplicated permease [Gemmatimonadales bacterium]